jgi:hypothetical protein
MSRDSVTAWLGGLCEHQFPSVKKGAEHRSFHFSFPMYAGCVDKGGIPDLKSWWLLLSYGGLEVPPLVFSEAGEDHKHSRCAGNVTSLLCVSLAGRRQDFIFYPGDFQGDTVKCNTLSRSLAQA